MTEAVCSGPPLVLLGAGGHAKVLLALAWAARWQVQGVCDPQLALQQAGRWRDLPVLGADEALDALDAAHVGLINGVGQLVGGSARRDLFLRLRQRGFRFPALVHPAAWVDPSASLAEGVQVMAGAVVQADCLIGENSIVNTGATIDHDCVIGAHVHVAPGAVLCGSVRVGNRAFIGGGAFLLQGLTVGECAVVGAGVTLARDVDRDETYVRHARTK